MLGYLSIAVFFRTVQYLQVRLLALVCPICASYSAPRASFNLIKISFFVNDDAEKFATKLGYLFLAIFFRTV